MGDSQEFDKALAEVNGVLRMALPSWLRVLLPLFYLTAICVLLVGCILFIVHLSQMGSETGPSLHLAALVTSLSGLLLTTVAYCAQYSLATRLNQAVPDVRAKLSELNVRYAGRGVHFQLQEVHQTSSTNTSCCGRGVADYTLVVQAAGASGAGSIPAPEVLGDSF